MTTKLSILAVCTVLLGCITVITPGTQKDDIPVPGKLEVYKGCIQAQGTVATVERGGVLIRTMQIDLVAASPEFLEDTWVVVQIVGRTKLAKITPQLLKENGYNKKTDELPKLGVTDRYCAAGFSFRFDSTGKLIQMEANTGSSDDTSTENPRMGSFSKTYSLALPCTVPQFGSVFGKPDKVLFRRTN